MSQFIENSKHKELTESVHQHIMGISASAPLHMAAKTELPHPGRVISPLKQGHGTNYSPHADIGNSPKDTDHFAIK